MDLACMRYFRTGGRIQKFLQPVTFAPVRLCPRDPDRFSLTITSVSPANNYFMFGDDPDQETSQQLVISSLPYEYDELFYGDLMREPVWVWSLATGQTVLAVTVSYDPTKLKEMNDHVTRYLSQFRTL